MKAQIRILVTNGFVQQNLWNNTKNKVVKNPFGNVQ